MMNESLCMLPRNENQARGIAQYAIDFCAGRHGDIPDAVWDRLELFHLDSVACGLSALAWGTRAPRILRDEALDYPTDGPWAATCFGSAQRVHAEKAVVANSSAVREWDSNGTNFGYNPARGATRGEFGHNDFYPVAMAGTQIAGGDGWMLSRAMLCLDEIRGRLAEVFALKNYKIDHVVHGAIASAAVFGALVGASVDQIESAIGMTVAHYVPFRAIRAGHQLSDSKGASAAISSEVAVLSVQRALRGFLGPADIFRNPQALFCLFEPPGRTHESPFDLALSTSGSDFAIMGMHFKLGLYEHQSAGAIQAVVDLLQHHPLLVSQIDRLRRIAIRIYEPAWGIIADPAKRDPQTRQSADHSLVYIVASVLGKAYRSRQTAWSDLMLLPEDYADNALHDPLTRALMAQMELHHGGTEFDRRYPEGIPTQVEIELESGEQLDSGLVMFPLGHALSRDESLDRVLHDKFRRLLAGAVGQPDTLMAACRQLRGRSAAEIAKLYSEPVDLSRPRE
jgi:2-methylcitrate dehydratase